MYCIKMWVPLHKIEIVYSLETGVNKLELGKENAKIPKEDQIRDHRGLGCCWIYIRTCLDLYNSNKDDF